jgi:hypothetical protein
LIKLQQLCKKADTPLPRWEGIKGRGNLNLFTSLPLLSSCSLLLHEYTIDEAITEINLFQAEVKKYAFQSLVPMIKNGYCTVQNRGFHCGIIKIIRKGI